MKAIHDFATLAESNITLAKMVLARLGAIAVRGARSENPEHVGYALQEIRQVLLESTGTEEIRFEPVPADQIVGLEVLLEELDLVDSFSESMAAEQIGKDAFTT